MKTFLRMLGNPRDLSAQQDGVNVGGASAITVDLPGGPTRQNLVWVVDSATLFYRNTNSDAFFSPFNGSGIAVIQIGAPPVNDVITKEDATNRGTMVENNIPFPNFAAVPTGATIVLRRPKPIVPYGFTLRGIYTISLQDLPSVPLGSLILRAIIREMEVCPC